LATARPFAYNTGSLISGTQQLGDLAIGVDSQAYNEGVGGVRWWNGPDEDLGYVIAQPVPTGDQPNPDFVAAYVGFFRTDGFTEAGFIELAERISNYTENFSSGLEAKTWLNDNGYWTSYTFGPVTNGLILNWDIQNSSSYSGSGNTITDLVGNINGTITGTITYGGSSPKYLTIEGGASEYIYTANINPYLSPANTGVNQSVFLWIYPISNGVIYSEQGSNPPDTGWFDVQIQRNSSGNFLFGIWPYAVNTAQITTASTYDLNNWYYVGWTYNGTTLTAYVNGTSVGTYSISRETPYNFGGSLPMYFNLGYPSTTDLTTTTSACTYWFGAMQIYNAGISSNDVLYNYNVTKSNYGIYTIETFSAVQSTTWVAPPGVTSVEYLIVAGGGGGGNGYDTGGGGGAGGGMVLSGNLSVVPGSSYSVVVGTGGTGGSAIRSNVNGTDGGNSSFDAIIALGGQGGYGSRSAPGGVGVKGLAQSSNVTSGRGGNGGGNQGSAVGGCGGGGGGAGGDGSNGTGSANNPGSGGVGGAGIASTISGLSATYGAGGNGARGNTAVTGANGTANTGKGGGGGSNATGSAGAGGNGGSGIVILKY
jgi:hypothetical protein